MRKTKKKSPLKTNQVEYVSTNGMRFLWRIPNQTTDDQEIVQIRGRDYKWGEYAKKVVSLLVPHYSKAVRIFSVNGIYNLNHAIKDDGQDRRA